MQCEKDCASALAGAFEQYRRLNAKSRSPRGSNLARHMPHVVTVTPLVCPGSIGEPWHRNDSNDAAHCALCTVYGIIVRQQ